MKKIIAVLLILSLLGMAGCTMQEKQSEKTEATEAAAADTSGIEQIAINLANDIVQKRFQEAYDNYDYYADMKKAISPEFFENDIGSVQEGFGEFAEMKKPIIIQKDGYIIVSIPMVFAKSKINYNIVFNGQNEIAGFNIGEYKQAEEQEAETQNSAVPISEMAQNFVKDLMEGNYEKAYNDYPHDAAMTGAVSAEAYEEMIGSLKEANGDFVKLGESFEYEADIYTVVAVPVEMSGENLNFEIYFNAQNQIAGVRFLPYHEIRMPENITEKELTANVNGHELGGTLTLPTEGENFPLVVLVHGSGPNDRDETVLSNKPFRDIAWGLASRGIAVYRYDKRSYVYNEEFQTGYDLTMNDETVDDAADIANWIKTAEGIDADNIFILGHSLGGYAMPRIAEKTPDAAGYIIMAGSTRAPHEVIPIQYEYLFGLDGNTNDDEKAILEAVTLDAEKIKNIDDYEKTEVFMGLYKVYIKDLLSYDPIETAKSIEEPVLVLQGQRDYQVTMTDYNMWHEAFADKDSWTFKLYPALNHLMIAGEGTPGNAEYSIAGHVDEGLIDDIADFIGS